MYSRMPFRDGFKRCLQQKLWHDSLILILAAKDNKLNMLSILPGCPFLRKRSCSTTNAIIFLPSMFERFFHVFVLTALIANYPTAEAYPNCHIITVC